MKSKLLIRLIKLEERKTVETVKPFKIIHSNSEMPADPENYNLIQIRVIDHSNYLSPDEPRLPYCPV